MINANTIDSGCLVFDLIFFFLRFNYINENKKKKPKKNKKLETHPQKQIVNYVEQYCVVFQTI